MKKAIKYIGIVGSRQRTDKENVEKLVNSLNRNDVVVSGGCFGVDSWAEERAKQRGLRTIVFKPDLQNIKDRLDMVQRYYARNKKIAQRSDIIFAFVSSARKGGTENTLKHARQLGRKIVICLDDRT